MIDIIEVEGKQENRIRFQDALKEKTKVQYDIYQRTEICLVK